MVYSFVPDVVLAPDRNPTPLSLEYLDDAIVPGRISESLFGACILVGLVNGDEGNPPDGTLLPKPLGLAGGGRLATRVPVRGGCGNDSAIDTARFGLEASSEDVSREDGMPDIRRPKFPPDGALGGPPVPGVVGRSEVRRIPWSDGFGVREEGRAGRAEVGGFEELKERGVRGIEVIDAAMVCDYYYYLHFLFCLFVCSLFFFFFVLAM